MLDSASQYFYTPINAYITFTMTNVNAYVVDRDAQNFGASSFFPFRTSSVTTQNAEILGNQPTRRRIRRFLMLDSSPSIYNSCENLGILDKASLCLRSE